METATPRPTTNEARLGRLLLIISSNTALSLWTVPESKIALWVRLFGSPCLFPWNGYQAVPRIGFVRQLARVSTRSGSGNLRIQAWPMIPFSEPYRVQSRLPYSALVALLPSVLEVVEDICLFIKEHSVSSGTRLALPLAQWVWCTELWWWPSVICPYSMKI